MTSRVVEAADAVIDLQCGRTLEDVLLNQGTVKPTGDKVVNLVAPHRAYGPETMARLEWALAQ